MRGVNLRTAMQHSAAQAWRHVMATLALALLLLPGAAHAWWDFGHKTIATIAVGEIRPQTARSIRALLRHAPALATPSCPLRTLEDASVWADCIKTLGPRFAYASSWHYQNVDICSPYDPEPACKDGNCVSRQIARAAQQLADRTLPPKDRLMALAFLTHFVGDLHMPLHAGDRADRGGNDLKTSYGVVAGRTNLHMMWDGPIAERAITTPPAGPAGLLAGLRAAERARRAGGNVEAWSRESWEISRDIAYASALGGDPCAAAAPRPPTAPRALVNETVIKALVPIARERITTAGLRLARMLDDALAPKPMPKR